VRVAAALLLCAATALPTQAHGGAEFYLGRPPLAYYGPPLGRDIPPPPPPSTG
jgi:hypothetical protein